MNFSSELILVSSKDFWNRFRIVGLESVSGIGFGFGIRIGSGIGIGSGIAIGFEIRIGFEIEVGFGIFIRLGDWIHLIAAKNPVLLINDPFSWGFSD